MNANFEYLVMMISVVSGLLTILSFEGIKKRKLRLASFSTVHSIKHTLSVRMYGGWTCVITLVQLYFLVPFVSLTDLTIFYLSLSLAMGIGGVVCIMGIRQGLYLLIFAYFLGSMALLLSFVIDTPTENLPFHTHKQAVLKDTFIFIVYLLLGVFLLFRNWQILKHGYGKWMFVIGLALTISPLPMFSGQGAEEVSKTPGGQSVRMSVSADYLKRVKNENLVGLYWNAWYCSDNYHGPKPEECFSFTSFEDKKRVYESNKANIKHFVIEGFYMKYIEEVLWGPITVIHPDKLLFRKD